jgi:peptidoglycan/LPS O-acetylase OafA/YrhL
VNDDGVAYGVYDRVSQTGGLEVGFFFVLSGSVLTWSARPADTPKSFWHRRIVKIYPNYVVAWILAMVLFAAAYTPAWRAVVNLFTLQVWMPDFDTNFSVDPPSWSLGAEAFFYACFPLLLTLATPSRRKSPVAWRRAAPLTSTPGSVTNTAPGSNNASTASPALNASAKTPGSFAGSVTPDIHT